MQLRNKYWGLHVKQWKKVGEEELSSTTVQKPDLVTPCLSLPACPQTHLDAPIFAPFISSVPANLATWISKRFTWGVLFPHKVHWSVWRPKGQNSKFAHKETPLQKTRYSGESFKFTMQQLHETKLSSITLIQNFRQPLHLVGPPSYYRMVRF